MKSFIVACAVAIVIAVIGGVVLGTVPDSAEHAFSSASSVRLGA
jgi:hypothetical protein